MWTEREIRYFSVSSQVPTLSRVVKPLLLLSLLSVQAFAIQIAPFRADVTPPIKSPAYGKTAASAPIAAS
jgi:hypothetical protein